MIHNYFTCCFAHSYVVMLIELIVLFLPIKNFAYFDTEITFHIHCYHIIYVDLLRIFICGVIWYFIFSILRAPSHCSIVVYNCVWRSISFFFFLKLYICIIYASADIYIVRQVILYCFMRIVLVLIKISYYTFFIGTRKSLL